MKITVRIEDERLAPSVQHVFSRHMEEYTLADVAIEGSAGLIAGTLRALAESIDPGPIPEWNPEAGS